MIIAVAGSSGQGLVVGLPAGPAALLNAVDDSLPDHVVLLTPLHLELRARAQAHVVVAAHPQVRVAVVPLPHHALTLTLIAADVAREATGPGGWSDPGRTVRFAQESAEHSRSIVWHPRVLGLQQPVPSVGQSAASLLKGFGYFADLSAGGPLTRGKDGLLVEPPERLYLAGEAGSLLAGQLGQAEARSAAVTVEPQAPYRTNRSVELCALVQAQVPVTWPRRCEICSASQPETGCVFCGTGSQGRGAPAAVAAVPIAAVAPAIKVG